MSVLKILSNIILVACVIVLQGNGSAATEAERRLRQDLFSNYSADLRPVVNDSDPVVVYLYIEPTQLLQINENEQFFEVSGWFAQVWQDKQLSWNVSDHNNLGRISVKPDLLWWPDISLDWFIHDGNTDHGGRLNQLKSKVVLTSDGMLDWYSRTSLKVGAVIDVYQFPYDSQECGLSFWCCASEVDLRVSNDSINTESFQHTLKWDLIESWTHSEVQYYEGNRIK